MSGIRPAQRLTMCLTRPLRQQVKVNTQATPLTSVYRFERGSERRGWLVYLHLIMNCPVCGCSKLIVLRGMHTMGLDLVPELCSLVSRKPRQDALMRSVPGVSSTWS